ncbi:unnamed protein product, partial [Clonostachys chloroleuca]
MSEQANDKHMVCSHPTWNIKSAKRAGPIRTYLPLAQQRDNFSLRLGTTVIRLVHAGSRVTGDEVQGSNGTREIINLSKNGRVVLSAGALATPRVLFNSGIGPKEQIEVAAKTDHPIFTLDIQTNGTWGPLNSVIVLDGSDTRNIDLYETAGSGVMTQGRHRLIFFSSGVGSDGVTRYFKGSAAPSGTGLIPLKVYLTHGLTSEGVLGLAEDGKTKILQSPYLQTEADVDAASTFIRNFVENLQSSELGCKIKNFTNVSTIINNLTSGVYFVGTAKIGTGDGRKGGSSVVDTNAKVIFSVSR